MRSSKSSRADAVVAARVAKAATDAANAKTRIAADREASLAPLRAQIHSRIPLALARLEAIDWDHPRVTMLKLEVPVAGVFGRSMRRYRWVEKAGYLLESHDAMYQGYKVTIETWLRSDGRVVRGGDVEILDRFDTDIGDLRAVLAGLDRLLGA